MPATYTIVIAEDDKGISAFLEKAFNRSDFDVVTTYDGDETIAAVKKHRPDIILLDISLPKKDGIHVLTELKSGASPEKDIPVIVLSCLDRPHEVRKGLEAGASEYICKPVFTEDLIKKVLTCLQKRH